MKRRIVFWLLATLCLVAVSIANAQQPSKLFRIGYLGTLDAAGESTRAESIRSSLREVSYLEGQNIVFEYRYTEGKVDRAPELADDLVRHKVDIILVAGGAQWIRAAMNATKTIPILMVGAGIDPVLSGLVESLARPGGNVTGVTNISGELGGKRLELIHEAVSKIKRVAVLYDPTAPSGVREVKELLPAAARALGLTIELWEVRDAGGLETLFLAPRKVRIDGLYVVSGPQLNANGKRIAAFALKAKLPSIYSYREPIDAGGLMYYGADFAASYRRVAYYVDKILKGAKPAELPVEQPTKFEFIVNLKTAKQIGLTIPPNLLVRADRVIR